MLARKCCIKDWSTGSLLLGPTVKVTAKRFREACGANVYVFVRHRRGKVAIFGTGSSIVLIIMPVSIIMHENTYKSR